MTQQMDITTQCINLLCNQAAEPKVSKDRCYECEIIDRVDNPNGRELGDYIVDQAGCRKDSPSYVITDYLACWDDTEKAQKVHDKIFPTETCPHCNKQINKDRHRCS